jgi:hypothetical protein
VDTLVTRNVSFESLYLQLISQPIRRYSSCRNLGSCFLQIPSRLLPVPPRIGILEFYNNVPSSKFVCVTTSVQHHQCTGDSLFSFPVGPRVLFQGFFLFLKVIALGCVTFFRPALTHVLPTQRLRKGRVRERVVIFVLDSLKAFVHGVCCR